MKRFHFEKRDSQKEWDIFFLERFQTRLKYRCNHKDMFLTGIYRYHIDVSAKGLKQRYFPDSILL